METKFGRFSPKEKVNLRLSYDRLIGKSLLVFDHRLSQFDFRKLLDQLLNTGIRIHWQESKLAQLHLSSNTNTWNHLAVVDNDDVHLIKLIATDIQVYPSDTLFEELDD